MDAFTVGINFVLQWEGGYIFDKRDPGGETNLGITDRQDGLIDHKVDIDGDGDGDVEIKKLTKVEAIAVYKRKYWDASGCGNLPNDMAIAVLDTAVNCGVSRAKKWLKDSVDVYRFLEKRTQYYLDLCARNPKMNVYRKGWLNRVNALKKLIEELAMAEH